MPKAKIVCRAKAQYYDIVYDDGDLNVPIARIPIRDNDMGLGRSDAERAVAISLILNDHVDKLVKIK